MVTKKRYKALLCFASFIMIQNITASQPLLELVVQEIPVTQTQKNDSKISEKRTIYSPRHWSTINYLLIEYPVQIAPEKFCKKVAAIAQHYNINTPVIPVTDSTIAQLKKLLNAVSDIERNYVYFNEDYVNLENPEFLTFIVGHELAHRKNNTPLYRSAIMRNNFMSNVQQNAIQLWSIYKLFGPKTINSTFVTYTLAAYEYFLLGIIAHHTFMPQDSIQICDMIELKCDTDAVLNYGDSLKEQIKIAQEGIAYFQTTQQTESWGQKCTMFLQRLMNNLVSPHPSHEARIKNLRMILKKLQEQLINNQYQKTFEFPDIDIKPYKE